MSLSTGKRYENFAFTAYKDQKFTLDSFVGLELSKMH